MSTGHVASFLFLFLLFAYVRVVYECLICPFNMNSGE